jgi:hypothetical protein
MDIYLHSPSAPSWNHLDIPLTEPEGSLPFSQKSTIGPYTEPAESSSPHRSLSL